MSCLRSSLWRSAVSRSNSSPGAGVTPGRSANTFDIDAFDVEARTVLGPGDGYLPIIGSADAFSTSNRRVSARGSCRRQKLVCWRLCFEWAREDPRSFGSILSRLPFPQIAGLFRGAAARPASHRDFRPGRSGVGLGSFGSGSIRRAAISAPSAAAIRSSRSIDALCLPRSRSLTTVRSTFASTARFSCVTLFSERNRRRFQAMRARVSIIHGHHLALH